MLDVAEAIDAGLDDEHANRHCLREEAEARLQRLAASGPPSPARAGISVDDADYLRRSADLDRRVAAASRSPTSCGPSNWSGARR